MQSNLLFKASAIIEILTGVALLIAPSLIIGLLLGDGLSTTGVAVARMLGIGLLSVGVAGWESREQNKRFAPRAGLCLYNIGAAVVLAVFGSMSATSGILLWPVVGLHSLAGVAMLWVILST